MPQKNSVSDFDRSKRGLQDDHDPSDIGQRSANQTGDVKPTDSTKQKPDTPVDADSMGGGSQGGM
jgi:hypothetical protein